jgi:hypothetical protein
MCHTATESSGNIKERLVFQGRILPQELELMILSYDV